MTMKQANRSTEMAVIKPRAPLVAGARPTAIVPTDMDSAYRLAVAVCEAGMAPKDLSTPARALIAIMHGLEIGLTPLAALQRIAIVNGRPTIWGDGAIGLVRGSGLCEFVREKIDGSGDGRVAICEAKRRGESESIKRTFSVADAKAAGLWGKQGPWLQYAERMLQMRARAFALRDLFADVLGGLYLREELEDEKVNWPTPPSPPPDDHHEARRIANVEKPRKRTSEPYAQMAAQKDEACPEPEKKKDPDYDALLEELNDSFATAKNVDQLEDIAERHQKRWYDEAPDGPRQRAETLMALHWNRLKKVKEQTGVVDDRAADFGTGDQQPGDDEPAPPVDDESADDRVPDHKDWRMEGRLAKETGVYYNQPPAELREPGRDQDLDRWRDGWTEKHDEMKRASQ